MRSIKTDQNYIKFNKKAGKIIIGPSGRERSKMEGSIKSSAQGVWVKFKALIARDN